MKLILKTLLNFGLSEPMSILIIVGISILAALLIWFLIYRTGRDRLYFIDISTKKRVFSAPEMTRSLSGSVKLKGKFYLFELLAKGHKDLCSLYGENAVNEYLERIVDRLEAEMPEGARISHFEKDKILVYLRDKKDFSITITAKTLKDIASRKQSVLKESIRVDFVVAVAKYPADGNTLELLLASLDTALGDVKRKPSDNTIVYSERITAAQPKEAKELQEIRDALSHDEFLLYYHPIVRTTTLEVVGAECLIRWQHPTKGLIPPSAFLPILERTGEIYRVGIWTFEEACKQLHEWRENTNNPKLWLSINMSIKQLSNSDIVKDFSKLLRKYDLDASDFFFEVYDYGVYTSMESVRDTVDRLVSMGFSISIDKFGKGSASLTELEKLPISQIKVDMPFLLHAKENVLYSGIIDALNMYVRHNNIMMVADGVENKEELEWSKLYKIDYMQGFFFAKPLPAEQFFTNVVLAKPWKNSGKTNGDAANAKLSNNAEQPNEGKQLGEVKEGFPDVAQPNDVTNSQQAEEANQPSAPKKPQKRVAERVDKVKTEEEVGDTPPKTQTEAPGEVEAAKEDDSKKLPESSRKGAEKQVQTDTEKIVDEALEQVSPKVQPQQRVEEQTQPMSSDKAITDAKEVIPANEGNATLKEEKANEEQAKEDANFNADTLQSSQRATQKKDATPSQPKHEDTVAASAEKVADKQPKTAASRPAVPNRPTSMNKPVSPVPDITPRSAPVKVADSRLAKATTVAPKKPVAPEAVKTPPKKQSITIGAIPTRVDALDKPNNKKPPDEE